MSKKIKKVSTTSFVEKHVKDEYNAVCFSLGIKKFKPIENFILAFIDAYKNNKRIVKVKL